MQITKKLDYEIIDYPYNKYATVIRKIGNNINSMNIMQHNKANNNKQNPSNTNN